VQDCNFLCHRCGEEVSVNNDRPGWTHYEWRRGNRAAVATAAVSQASSQRSRRRQGKLEAALDKIEKRMLGPGECRELAVEPEQEQAEMILTYCNTCLEELASNGQNRRLVEEILHCRQADAGHGSTRQ
jgi:DNA repair ATPase RecN